MINVPGPLNSYLCLWPTALATSCRQDAGNHCSLVKTKVLSSEMQALGFTPLKSQWQLDVVDGVITVALNSDYKLHF